MKKSTKITILFLIVLECLLYVFGFNIVKESYYFLNLGSPSDMFYMPAVVESIDVNNKTLTVINEKDESYTVKYSIFDDYAINENADLICDSNKKVIGLYSYYTKNIELSIAIVLAGVVILILSIFFILLNNIDEDDIIETDDNLDINDL